jgi:hypothetical protein
VTEQSRVIAATVAGAVLGTVAGFVFFTESGRAWRRQLEPALDDLAREIDGFRHTVHKAIGVASEGWKLLTEAIGEEAGGASRYAQTRQTTPF